MAESDPYAAVEAHSWDNNQLQVQIQMLNADKDSLSTQISQYETQIHTLEAAKGELTAHKSEFQARIRALEAEKDDLTTCNEEYQDRTRTLEAEKVDLISRNEEYQDRIRTLEVEKADLTSRNEENQSQIQTLIQTHQHESERLETANSKLDDQINDLQEAVGPTQLDNNKFASQIEDLTAKNQELVTEAEDQSRREQQHLDTIAQLTVELGHCDQTFRNTLNEADEQRSLNLQDKQQLQRVLFSNVLSLQGDKDGSLLAASTRLFFKQQERLTSQIPASWIKEPLGDTLDQLTKSEVTASLVKTYQLALQGLSCLHANGDFPDSLLSHLMSCQQWLNTACKDHTSILGLALDFAIKTIKQGSQSEPWFSTSRFDAARMINSTNSDLPNDTSIIANGFAGVVLIVQGMDVHVLEASDIVMRQQESRGVLLAFAGGLALPTLQLLPNSWPGYSRWSVLCSWALNVGRFSLVMGNGKMYEPSAL